MLHQKLWENCYRITVLILISFRTSYILSMIMSFLTIKYGTRNKRQLLRYSGIRNSLTKGYESCCWHTWIKIWVPSTTITPYLGTYLVLRNKSMLWNVATEPNPLPSFNKRSLHSNSFLNIRTTELSISSR